MNSPVPSSILLLLRYARPWSLLAGGGTYLLGAVIAKYLGYGLQSVNFWVGLLLVILLLLSSYLLKAYYDLIDADSPLRRMQKNLDDEDVQAAGKLSHQAVLLMAFTVLTAGAAITVLLFAQGALPFPAMMILGLALACGFFYGVPPLRLVYNGYGELSEGVLIAGLLPALGFLLQTGDLHRMLPMFSFPLLAFYLAMRLAQSLENYTYEQKLAHRTLILQLGWARGMSLHNFLVLGGYLLLGAAAVFGLPWPLTWPGLLTLPLGIFQVIQISQIAVGAKPAWGLLRITSAATFAVTVYLIIWAVWTG